MNGRFNWLASACIAVSIMLSLQAWFYLDESKAASRDAAANLQRMRQLKYEIVELRKRQSVAQLAGEQTVESSSAWIRYGQAAGIPEQKVVEISRLPISKIEGTGFSRDDVFIRMVDVSAKEVVQFLVSCNDASVGYLPTSVQLSAKSGKLDKTERWNAGLVLTRLLYDATTPL